MNSLCITDRQQKTIFVGDVWDSNFMIVLPDSDYLPMKASGLPLRDLLHELDSDAIITSELIVLDLLNSSLNIPHHGS